MSAEAAMTLAQLATVALAVLAIIWNQQRSTDKLRDDFNQANARLRSEFSESIGHLRAEVSHNGQRLARIEGFLRIGLPDPPEPPTPRTEPPEPDEPPR